MTAVKIGVAARRIAALGPLEVDGPDGRTTPGSARQRRLLTILAVGAFSNRALGTDELLDALYGDDDMGNTRRALSTELWRCRQLLGADAVVTSAEGHRLDPSAVRVDLVEFRTAIAAGREALRTGAFGEAVDRYDAALELWHGDPLADWTDGQQARAVLASLGELRLGCVEDKAEALAGLGRNDDAIRLLESVVEAEPQREHAWALLAECLLAVGDRRRASAAFDTARRVLAEHGVDPGAELSAVRDLIASSTVVRRPAPAVADLLGRAEVLTVLSSAVTAALRGPQTTLAVISGEAGIGKSAVVDRLAEGLGTGDDAVQVVSVACDRRLTRPYAVVEHLLTRFGESAGASPAAVLAARDSGDEAALTAAVAGLLETAAVEAGGLLLVVEDAHWATLELLEMLRVLVVRRALAPLAVLLTLREPASVSDDVARAVAELTRRAQVTHHLDGLDDHEVAELLGVGADQARELRELTGGNPLYLRHLSVLPDGTVAPSRTLDDALDEHIDALPVEALEAMEVAATIGKDFDLRVLTSALAHRPLGLDAMAVAEAVATATAIGLLAPTDPRADSHRASFSHALARDRLYARTPSRRRTVAHALVAQALRRRPDAVETDLLAHHSRRGWPICGTADAVSALRGAGDAAYRQLGFTEALNYYDQALDLIAMDPDFDASDETRPLLMSAGRAAVTAGDLDRGRALYDALRQHGRAAGDPVTALEGSTGILQTYFDERVSATALEAVADDIALALSLEDPPDTMHDLGIDALALLHLYQPARAHSLRERFAARFPAVHARVLERTWIYEPVAEAVALTAELAALPDADPLGTALRAWASEVAAGRRSLHDARDTWTLRGSDQAHWESRLWRTMAVMARGEFDRADRLIAATEADVSLAASPLDHTTRAGQLMGQRQFVAVQRGDFERLVRLAAELRPSMASMRPTIRFNAALQLAMSGDRDGAWARCDRLYDEFRAGVVPGQELHATVAGYLQACSTIEHEAGLELARELFRPHVGEHVVLSLAQYWGSVRHQIGKVSAFFEDLDDAEEQLRGALEEHHEVGAPVYVVHSLRALASVLWHRGKRAEAEQTHAQCTALATTLGMVAVAGRSWPPPHAYAGI
ncbi:tetratricopeptide repeat protein [Nocardioides albidus]|uniref:Tetratricopeptide repeat protein n=1 Tax=Nocardioides albidus TaxID=1517589 RepID=A0A5C4VXC2_9ACTN|nr:BTAD domain-containing putative transcriptional regulator [Nocardioides albidus]TNM40518.1 tetratricopeptide repeat protein [Nocardioides albidus]